MFRIFLTILALSVVAYGNSFPEALGDDFPPEALTISDNVLPDAYEDNVLSEALQDDLLPEAPGDPSRIIGGTAASISSVPWQLVLLINGAFNCGAVLISSTWALSAAHCTHGRAASTMRLVGGTANRLSGGQSRQVSRIINHPSYSDRGFDNDICLMRVATAFTLGTNLRAAGLPAQGTNFAAGTYGVISGWGATREGATTLPTMLQSARVPVVAQAACRSSYGSIFTNNMMCAGYLSGGRDACQNDSGGPFAIGSVVAGITSFGQGCGRPNFPGVYARVAVYRNWIRTNAGV